MEPIKRSVCWQYAKDFDFDEEQADDLWFYIARMDRDFLKWYKSKQPKPKPSHTGGRFKGGKHGRRP